MAIRYDKKLNQEINRVIRNFNQKVARLEKEQRELTPAKVSKKELKGEVYTRAELRRELNKLRRFSKRGAEDVVTTQGGVRTTQYELENIKRETARVKSQLTRRINTMKYKKPKIFGKETAGSYASMGDSDYTELVAKRKSLDKDIDKIDKDTLSRLKSMVGKLGKNKHYMDTMFKENYINMLTSNGYFVGYDNEKLELLKSKLMQLKPDDFYRLFQEDKSIQAVLDYYPFMSGKIKGAKNQLIDPSTIKDDVTNLYDNLIDNIDEILKGYV